MTKNNNSALFETMPVSRAVVSLAVPTVISQLITVIYNMADTFFVGQLNDPAQVAASTIAMPLFMLLTGIANLFGIGGASLISRSLGAGDSEKARRTAAFSIFTGAATALVYGIVLLFLQPVILPALGANADTDIYIRQYLFWTVTVGAVPTVLNSLLAHLVRAEGYARQASIGVALGGILNMLLDPLFIFAFGMQIRGAAIATMLSNLAAVGYFAVLLYKKRAQTVILPDIRRYTLGEHIPREVIAVGLTSFCMSMMGTVSNMVLNRIIAGYSNEAIAGMGIAKRIDLVAYAISQGMTQGVLPLIAYNYAAGNRRRMKDAIRAVTVDAMAIALAATVLLFAGATFVTRLFIDNAETVTYGRGFLRIIALACPLTTLNCIAIMIFQAIGKKVQPLLLSIMRKGVSDIPFMFLYNALLGVQGVPWSTPTAECIGLIFSGVFLTGLFKELKREEGAHGQHMESAL